MNKWIGIGRTTRDAEIRYSQGANGAMAIAKFTLAVDRRGKDNGADFISCVAFGKTAEFLEKYGRRGVKFVVEGRVTTGSYNNKDGNKVYTTDINVENIEFAESKNVSQETVSQKPQVDADGFMAIDPSFDGELPFI